MPRDDNIFFHDDPPACIHGDWWLTREIQRPTPVLGEVICTTTRALLGGPTGAGKTHLAMAMAAAIATGNGFLHWLGPSEPLTVLYIDGEMARDLIADRMRDLHRRLGKPSLANLHVLCREDFPAMAGLNTEVGQQFILEKIDKITPSVVFLDNRMCLLVGDMKDEEVWSDTMPLVLDLTKRRVAQIWLDHTGHATDRVYGSKTKEWQMDAVILIEQPENPEPEADIHLRLKFTKARRRRPETRDDFASAVITLKGDAWAAVRDGERGNKGQGHVTPQVALFHQALQEAIRKFPDGPARTLRQQWEGVCIQRGLVEPHDDTDNKAARTRRTQSLRTAQWKLQAARKIKVDGNHVTDLTLVVDPLAAAA